MGGLSEIKSLGVVDISIFITLQILRELLDIFFGKQSEQKMFLLRFQNMSKKNVSPEANKFYIRP